ncbi:hypothetical protein E0Z10_g1273 [Xylaria hypoxylon]|uniref:Uncharacterized protein n=1 Tax=Xylaria hypoxylon TaxID=37992 RepID=A0A4Z0Z7N3_9PEZI|nr:hypothetical protein E0Z10_g1273 [Xylaria hypoxylon]
MSLFTRNSTRNQRSSHNDAVTYLSTRGERYFVAEAPANSPHAAKLAQIAMAIQEDRPQENQHSGTTRAAISEGLRCPQIENGSNVPRYDGDSPPQDDARRTASPPRYDTASEIAVADNRTCPCCHAETLSQRRPSYQDAMPDENSEPDAASMASAAITASSASEVSSVHVGSSNNLYDPRHPLHHHQVYEQPRVPISAPLSQQAQRFSSVHTTPHVTRYTTKTTTAYQVDNGKGNLYVFAPIGSNEARLFDAVADAHSFQSQRNSHENKEVTRGIGHRSMEAKRGWWW